MWVFLKCHINIIEIWIKKKPKRHSSIIIKNSFKSKQPICQSYLLPFCSHKPCYLYHNNKNIISLQLQPNLNHQKNRKHTKTMTSPSIKSDDKLRKSQQQRNSNALGTPRRSNMSLSSKLGSDECASKGFLSWMRVFRLSNLMVNQGC